MSGCDADRERRPRKLELKELSVEVGKEPCLAGGDQHDVLHAEIIFACMPQFGFDGYDHVFLENLRVFGAEPRRLMNLDADVVAKVSRLQAGA